MSEVVKKYLPQDTERLVFREWRIAEGNPLGGDFEHAKLLWGDPRVTKLIDKRPQLNDEAVQVRLQKELDCMKLNGYQYWPMFLRATNEFVGVAGLKHRDGEGEKMLETGAHLLPAFWGNKFAEEATTSVLHLAFEVIGAEIVYAGHHPNNEGSRHVLARLGFEFIADELYQPTGLLHPWYKFPKEKWFLKHPKSIL